MKVLVILQGPASEGPADAACIIRVLGGRGHPQRSAGRALWDSATLAYVPILSGLSVHRGA